ncbi:unnamed protein product, partial [Owenia fusiformis]
PLVYIYIQFSMCFNRYHSSMCAPFERKTYNIEELFIKHSPVVKRNIRLHSVTSDIKSPGVLISCPVGDPWGDPYPCGVPVSAAYISHMFPNVFGSVYIAC